LGLPGARSGWKPRGRVNNNNRKGSETGRSRDIL
jgi:hypothetical protein